MQAIARLWRVAHFMLSDFLNLPLDAASLGHQQQRHSISPAASLVSPHVFVTAPPIAPRARPSPHTPPHPSAESSPGGSPLYRPPSATGGSCGHDKLKDCCLSLVQQGRAVTWGGTLNAHTNQLGSCCLILRWKRVKPQPQVLHAAMPSSCHPGHGRICKHRPMSSGCAGRPSQAISQREGCSSMLLCVQASRRAASWGGWAAG